MPINDLCVVSLLMHAKMYVYINLIEFILSAHVISTAGLTTHVHMQCTVHRTVNILRTAAIHWAT